MRDTFIDINTSRPFNGDPPYIFRFEEGQSIGLNYIKKICMVSDSPTATIRTEPNQEVFRILRMTTNMPTDIREDSIVNLNLKVYVDINKLIAPDNRWGYDVDPDDPDPLMHCNGFEYVTKWYYPPEDPVTHMHDDPTPEESVYIYMFYILGRAEEPGEYLGRIWINEREYKISADFYAENEVLKENLKNFESKLPESIQKAIYESNVHEDLNDNILINRKNKELLMNYMSILGNKGSYESLLNSINWFEWGELLRLEEFWKRYINDNLDYDYFATELNHILTPEDTRLLTDNVKSTFLGLYCTLCKLQKVRGRMVYQDSFGRANIQSMTSWQDHDSSHMYAPSDLYDEHPELIPAFIWDLPYEYPEGVDPSELGVESPMSEEDFLKWRPGTIVPGTGADGDWAKIVYPDGSVEWVEMAPSTVLPSGATITYWTITYNYLFNEQMPNLLRVAAMWTGQDLSLKMSVLGNFFSTFFMPIHLDLIHSCIEYWAYAYALKQIYTQSVDEKSFIIALKSFDMVWESDLKIAPHPETMSYVDTLFRNYNTEKVFGFSTDPSRHEYLLQETSSSDPGGGDFTEYNKDILRYMYKGECCPVRFIGKIYTGIQDPYTNIYRQKLIWYKEGNSELTRDEIPSYHEYHFYKDPDTGEFYEINDANRDRLLSYDPEHYDPEDPNGIPNDGHTYSGNRGCIDTSVSVSPEEEYVLDSIPVYDSWHYYKVLEDSEYVFYPITDNIAKDLEFRHEDTYHKEMVFNLDFNVGFKEEGDYVIYLEFYTSNNRIYAKKFNISISDYMHNQVEVMKMVPSRKESWGMVKPPIELYQYAEGENLSKNFTDSDILLQSHFFSAGASGNPEKAGLNHTLIGIVEKDYGFDGDTDFDPDMNKTIWTDGNTEVNASSLVCGEFEGTTYVWEDSNGDPAVWKDKDFKQYLEDHSSDPWEDIYDYWAPLWPWGEFPNDPDEALEKSESQDGMPIPDTLISGTLNNIVKKLEEEFNEYWWSWDRIQVSKRDNTLVKIDTIGGNPFNPIPKGNIVKKLYPDEYPAQ